LTFLFSGHITKSIRMNKQIFRKTLDAMDLLTVLKIKVKKVLP